MRPVLNHPWKLSVEKAEELQKSLSRQVSLQCPFKDPEAVKTVAALDVHYDEKGDAATAAAAVFELPSLKLLEKAVAREKAVFPYVPGLLSFREIPPLLKALEKLKTAPDVLLVDGQGLAHPRRFGLACHVGLLMDRPSIGCAKTWLFGEHDEPPPGLPGAYTFLRNGDEMVGAALRTRPFVQPLYVSPGHKMGVLTAVDLVMACVKDNRVPEPLRAADRLTRAPASPRAAKKSAPRKKRAK